MTRSISLLLAILVTIPGVADAITIDDISRPVFVVFKPNILTDPPYIEAGTLVLADDPGKVTLAPISWVMSIDPVYPAFSDLHRVEGPWLVRILTTMDMQATLAALEARPEVQECFDGTVPYPGTVQEPLGENAKAWFPPEADPGTGGFCRAQNYLHFPNPNEQPQPVLEIDGCAWVLDPQTPNPWPNSWFPVDLDLPQAWAITRGDSNVVVAIVDLGVEWTHSDLGGNGPDPATTPLAELLAAYRGGSVFHNYREAIGDANGDGVSGAPSEDEDRDGLFNEDPTGLFPGNLPEPDVRFGTATSAINETITDASANWAPNELVGLHIRPFTAVGYTITDSIVANTETVITTSRNQVIDYLIINGHGGWAYFVPPGTTYMISDLHDEPDSLLDGRDEVVDDWWPYDPSDDDENGFVDDLKGWDFTTEQFRGPFIPIFGDGDVRPPAPSSENSKNRSHGTWNAGIVAARADSNGTGIVGIAPGVKIVPVRIGDTAAGYAAQGIEYARKLRNPDGTRAVDIIVLAYGSAPCGPPHQDHSCETWARQDSLGNYLGAEAAQIRAALDEGMIVVNGAGNDACEIFEPFDNRCFDEVLVAGGVNANQPWLGIAGEGGTTYGDWVDVSAQATGITSTSLCNQVLGCPCAGPGGFNDAFPDQYLGWKCYIWGTSVASPQVGAVAALMLSANPNLSPDELRRKLVASVDPIDYSGYPQVAGKLGSGRINAYKALTQCGDIPAAQSDTTWSGEVWVSGDIRVAAGKTLTIATGTVVHVAQDDIADQFDVPRQIEFRVAGTLVCNGAVGDSVVFRPFWECPGTPIWGPMTTEGAGSIVTQYTRFEGLTPDRVLYPNGGEALAAGAPAQLTWTADLIQTPCTPPVRMLDKVDLYTSSDGGQTWSVIALGVQNTGSYQWTAGPPLVTEEGRVKVVFKDSSGAWRGEDVSDADFWVIAPWLMGTFVDRSSETQLDYEGMPYSSIAFDYNGDTYPDLMISQSDAVGRLFARTTLSGNQAPQFVPKTQLAFALGSEPRPALRGLSFTSFDGDSYPDVFAARDTGAQLFRNKGVPQGGGEVTFEDLADSLGVSGSATKSYGGSWADYDGDGKPDLLIARAGSSGGIEPQGAGSPQPLVLLRNNTNGPTGTFENVSASSLITPPGDLGIDARTVTWADFDADGDQDVFVGNRGNLGSRLYVNQGNGTFQLASGDPAEVGKVTAAAWGDLDGDQDLDLAVAVAPGNPATPHLVWFANQGSGVLGTQTALDTGYLGAEGVHILDANLDRRMDLVVLPGASDTLQTPHLLLQGPPGFPAGSFADATVTFGLGASRGSVGGASVTDYDGDRRADLFLGRPVAGGRYYFRNEALPSQSPPPGVVVQLVGGGGGNDPMGTGALVTLLHNAQPVAAQPVDGGSSRGGQRARDLVFGADGGGVFEAETTWSEGFVQRDTLVVGQHNVVQDRTDPTINHATMTASYQPEPGGTATLTFGWSSAWRGRNQLNAVTLSSTAGCLNEPVTYWASDPNVDLAVAKQGSVVTYTLTVYGVPCIPNCTYTWYCQTSTDFKTSTTVANPKTFKTKVCAQ